jgi:hypothetical protein
VLALLTIFYHFHTLYYFVQVPCTHHVHCFHVLCCSNYSPYSWLCVYLVLPFALCCKWYLKECGIVAVSIPPFFVFF